jgi:P27 family predicted phage terminase small subunit
MTVVLATHDRSTNMQTLTHCAAVIDLHSGHNARAAPQLPHNTPLTPPPWLTPLARKHWDEIAVSLLKHNIINELDQDMLAVYCSTFARFIELDIELEKVGMTQKTSTGYEAETGTFTAWNKLLKPIMAYAKQLGLTPPARVALRLTDPEQTDLPF